MNDLTKSEILLHYVMRQVKFFFDLTSRIVFFRNGMIEKVERGSRHIIYNVDRLSL